MLWKIFLQLYFTSITCYNLFWNYWVYNNCFSRKSLKIFWFSKPCSMGYEKRANLLPYCHFIFYSVERLFDKNMLKGNWQNKSLNFAKHPLSQVYKWILPLIFYQIVTVLLNTISKLFQKKINWTYFKKLLHLKI